LKQTLKLSEYQNLNVLWGSNGEVILTEPLARKEDVIALRSFGWKIVKFSSNEILAKNGCETNLRWTPKTGAEIVVSLRHGRSSLQGLVRYPSYLCDNKEECRKTWRASCCDGHYCGKLDIFERQLSTPLFRKDFSNKSFLYWGETDFVLGEELTAYITIKKDGQENISSGDRIRVLAEIGLPTNKNNDLHEKLVFDKRLEIGGQRLDCWWGKYIKDRNLRTIEAKFYAAKWDIAAWEGYQWAVSELEKLKTALKNRKEALKNA